MKLTFEVHGAHPSTVSKSVLFDGETVTATVDGYEVELIGDASVVLRFIRTADIEEAKEKFKVGSSVTWEI